MVLLSAGVIVSFGATAVNESEESLSADRAEKVMTQMDSEISMVALGRSESQQISFDRVPGEQFSVDETSGQINITTVGNNPQVIMENTSLGAVEFTRGDTVVAYQGGGVWRSDSREGSGMVSPPEFNYRDRTLTLPLVTVTGDQSLARGAVIEKNGDSTSYFPNATAGLRNPLEDEIVRVTIWSEFHDGWTRYFKTRTEGSVDHFPEEQRVAVNLTAAAIQGFNHAAATTTSDMPNTGPRGQIVGSTRTGITAPSVSPDVDERITDCDTGAISCTPVDGSWFNSNDPSAGTYYADNSLDINGDPDFNTDGGDIELVIDGDLDIKGGADVDISGDGQTRIYVHGDVKFNGNPDTNNNPENLVVLVHSSASEVKFGGNQKFSGYVYAPNSRIFGAGSPGDIYGGVVGGQIDLGNQNLYHEVPDFQLKIGQGINALTFLHISTNPVTVSGT